MGVPRAKISLQAALWKKKSEYSEVSKEVLKTRHQSTSMKPPMSMKLAERSRKVAFQIALKKMMKLHELGCEILPRTLLETLAVIQAVSFKQGEPSTSSAGPGMRENTAKSV